MDLPHPGLLNPLGYGITKGTSSSCFVKAAQSKSFISTFLAPIVQRHPKSQFEYHGKITLNISYAISFLIISSLSKCNMWPLAGQRSQ